MVDREIDWAFFEKKLNETINTKPLKGYRRRYILTQIEGDWMHIKLEWMINPNLVLTTTTARLINDQLRFGELSYSHPCHTSFWSKEVRIKS